MTRPKRIGLAVVPTNYGHHILAGIARYARSQSRWQFVVAHWDSPGSVLGTLDECDGIIAFFTVFRMLADQVIRRGLPAVNVASTRIDPRFGQVIPDNVAVGRLAAEHFLSRGFRNFGWYGMPKVLCSQERAMGYCQAVIRAGMTCSKLLLADVMGSNTSCWHARRRRLAQWIALAPKPIAILADGDARGREILTTCGDLGIRVPEEAAVIGVNNDAFICDFTDPPLSSFELPGDLIGYEAAALLARMMAGRRPPREPILVCPMGIVTRQSSDIVAVSDPQVARVMRYIREHASQPMSVKEMLREIPISRRWLEKRFRELLGRGPAEEIRRMRLERARMLLADTRLSVERVARDSGFANASRMEEAFHRSLGLTPSGYRKRVGPRGPKG